LSCQSGLQDGHFLGEPACLFLGVGQLRTQALFGDEGTGGKLPGSLVTGLALAVAGGGDAGAEFGVGVEQRYRDAGAAANRGETDRLSTLLKSVEGVRGLLTFASVVSAAARRRAALLSAMVGCCPGDGRRLPGRTGGAFADSCRGVVDEGALAFGKGFEQLLV